MFEKNISRKTYNMIGMIFIFIGISFMGLSVYMYLSPIESVNYEKVRADAFAKCETAVMKHGRLGISWNKDIKNGKALIYSRRMENAVKQVYASSYIIEKCDDFVVKDYCFGEGCENQNIGLNSGFYMDLSFKYQDKL